jgi:hypothetical protein
VALGRVEGLAPVTATAQVVMAAHAKAAPASAVEAGAVEAGPTAAVAALAVALAEPLGGRAATVMPAARVGEPALPGLSGRPALDMAAALGRIMTAKTMAAASANMAPGNTAGRRLVAARMVVAVTAIKAAKAARGVMTMAARGGTP